MKKLFRYFLTFVIFGSGYALAQAPVISSASTASATVGVPFSYEITTVDDDALVYGIAGSLPEGVTRSGAILSGTPTEAGSFTVTLSATNASGSGTLVLSLIATNPLPIITPDVPVQAKTGRTFFYQIIALYATSYNAVGLTQIGGLTLDTTTGIISGVPINDGDFDVLLIANNSAGQSTEVLNIVVLPAQTSGGQPTVEILSPSRDSDFEGSIKQIFISAAITPSAVGEVIDTVYVQWMNPPPLPNSNIQTPPPIILSTLSLASSDGSAFNYEGNVSTGFNPGDRELGGGAIELQVVAYQTNAVSDADTPAASAI